MKIFSFIRVVLLNYFAHVDILYKYFRSFFQTAKYAHKDTAKNIYTYNYRKTKKDFYLFYFYFIFKQ